MSEKKKIWVTGASGYMGQALMPRLTKAGYEVVGTDKRLDITDGERLQDFAQELRPFAIINCAGIRRDATTLLNRIKAYEVNAMGAHNVALAAEASNAIMIQVSSDDVYSAHTLEPVNEFDTPNADTPYGKSKKAGEATVRDTIRNHIILRSSWLYSNSGGRLKNLLDAARNGQTIEARTDQFAAPTSIDTYAAFLIKVMEGEKFGTFNVATSGKCNRFQFASKALEVCGFDPAKVLVPVEDPATAENVILESLMNEMTGIMTMPSWEDDLVAYLQAEGLAQ